MDIIPANHPGLFEAARMLRLAIEVSRGHYLRAAAQVQDAAGHVDPRTIRRYDRAQKRLDGHAA